MKSRFKDIIEKIGSSTRYNLHSHTQFCDGHAPMDEMVEGAVRAGLRHYGFTPHGPMPLTSPCNMSADEVTPYLNEASRLRELYSDRIDLYTGMEADYLGKQWGPHSAPIQDLDLDYIIGSVHFVPTQDGSYADTDGRPERFRRYVHELFRDDLRYVVDAFFAQTLEKIDRGGFDIIGHFDKIGLNSSCMQPDIEDNDWYRIHIEHVIEAVAAKGLTVEINTKHYAAWQRFFPAVRWWPMLKAAGVHVVFNSDAHDPQLTDASRQIAINLWQQNSNS
ncbi:MAG: histidinol-phosphatase [Muribaculaceae bacterium]|nr:histidinol-phosphatase [Muribaculaceae bacterium]